jgi:hypothetical protein
VAFVVVGLVLIIAGLLLRWRWVRGFWFRVAHLTAIASVVAMSWARIDCPLTVLENRLRVTAGESGYPSGFLAYWLHRIIFYDASPQTFAVIYTIFGVLVIAVWIWGRPRWPRSLRQPRQ